MVYAYVFDTPKPIDFNMHKANCFITNFHDYTLVKGLILPTDSLLIESASLLGNSVQQIIKELLDLYTQCINFTVLDNVTICSENKGLYTVLHYLDELNLQKSTRIGRPEVKPQISFGELYRMYLNGDTQKAIELSGLSRATFYRKLAKYEEENGFAKRRNNQALEYGKHLQKFHLDNSTLEQYPLSKL